MITREPTLRDVRYGPHERNVLDLYRAESAHLSPLYVFIHGGGFRAGDKSGIDLLLLDQFLDSGISVAAVNYRLSGQAPYPAAMVDCARAVQFLRHRAGEWGLDPTRFAAGGGSAGAGITYWIGFRPDMANPRSEDPVERESTRLTCIVNWEAQSSYDPNFIRVLISGPAYRHEALQEFFRLTPDQYDTPQAREMFREASGLPHVSSQAPPVLVWYFRPNLPMTPDLPANHGIHHPRFGYVLKDRMDEVGVECIVRGLEDFPEAAPVYLGGQFRKEAVEFLRRHFGMGEA